MVDGLPIISVMAAEDIAGSEPDELPVDFFELEVIANKPIPEMGDRELPEIEVETKPGELPVDFFDLEVIANKPIPEMSERDFGNDESTT